MCATPLLRLFNESIVHFWALWLCGFVVVWLCGSVALWLFGFAALWLCGFVDLLLCGFVALWFCGVVVVFLHGFVRCGFMALRLCGFVALWLCAFKFCASRKSEILMFSQSVRREDFVRRRGMFFKSIFAYLYYY